jgi:hypothetical protein
MRRRPRTTRRSRRQIQTAVLCLGAGAAAFLFGYPRLDASVSRYFAFVAGGALVISGLLVLSLRLPALALAAFVAAVAFEGPISSDGAAAVHVLDGVQVPGYVATARGFLGNTREFPYRVFVGPPDLVGPSMVTLPPRFRRDLFTGNDPLGLKGSGSSLPPDLVLHDGYETVASWHWPRLGKGSCSVQLEVADPARVVAALSVADEPERLALDGKAVIHLIASCAPESVPRPGTSPPTTGPFPNTENAPIKRGAPH